MRVYLDNNATTSVLPEVWEAYQSVVRSGPRNPGSPHESGRRAREIWLNAASSVQASLGLADYNVLFLSSATEAINLALRSFSDSSGQRPIALSTVEHPATWETAKGLGPAIKINVDRNSQIQLPDEAVLTDASLICAMLANNETGAIIDLHELAELARSLEIPMLIDACQVPGRMDCAPMFQELRPAALVLSGHKIHAPVGIAALLVREDVAIKAQTTGGGQQGGLRSGTEPVALAHAFAKALDIAISLPELERQVGMRDRLREAILSAHSEAQITLERDFQLANTLHYRIPGLQAERQIIALDLAGVECSSASACQSGAATPSRVLQAMGYTEREAQEGIRLCVSRLTTDEEVDFACDVIRDTLPRLAGS